MQAATRRKPWRYAEWKSMRAETTFLVRGTPEILVPVCPHRRIWETCVLRAGLRPVWSGASAGYRRALDLGERGAACGSVA
ncbi:hypothetical protein GCM10009610_49580 [Pseudonocardia xinjiangensis]